MGLSCGSVGLESKVWCRAIDLPRKADETSHKPVSPPQLNSLCPRSHSSHTTLSCVSSSLLSAALANVDFPHRFGPRTRTMGHFSVSAKSSGGEDRAGCRVESASSQDEGV